MREAEQFLSANGSDCGIANVNIGTPWQKLAGHSGGEKGNRMEAEQRIDSWRAYSAAKPHTITTAINLPLAQGIIIPQFKSIIITILNALCGLCENLLKQNEMKIAEI